MSRREIIPASDKHAAVRAAWDKLGGGFGAEAERLRDEYRAACRAAAPLRGEILPKGGEIPRPRRAPQREAPPVRSSPYDLYRDTFTGETFDGFEASARRLGALMAGICIGLAGFLLSIPIACATGWPLPPLFLIGGPVVAMVYGSVRYAQNPNYRPWWEDTL